MNYAEARKQIYEYLKTQGLELTADQHEQFRELIKQCVNTQTNSLKVLIASLEAKNAGQKTELAVLKAKLNRPKQANQPKIQAKYTDIDGNPTNDPSKHFNAAFLRK
ncbi:MAG: hypothetical protein AAB432_01930 [Patescibacteria group bacterium]